jgi:hypothetical protein
MRKYALLIVAAVAVLALPSAASAQTANCGLDENGDPNVVSVNPTATFGEDVGANVCLDLGGVVSDGGDNRFDGGKLYVGVDLSDGVLPNPDGYTTLTPENFPPQLVQGGQVKGDFPGAFVVADGDDENSDFARDDADGYIGVSNYENGTPDPSCDGEDTNAASTNSGGCVTLRDPSTDPETPILALPVPLLVGGSDSGSGFGNSTRDGWSVP